jgi:hypothetical protein
MTKSGLEVPASAVLRHVAAQGLARRQESAASDAKGVEARAAVSQVTVTAPPDLAAEAPPRPPVQIVPLRGLPIVAAVLGLLVAAVAGDWLGPLNLLHIIAGGLWTGIDLFLGLVIGPIIGRMSVSARTEFSARLMPKMLLIMPTLVTVTLVSGWQLATHLGYANASYPHHAWLVASFIVVGVMAVIAVGILEPANLAVLFELRKPQPNGALIGKLMRRFVYTAGITGLMQVATLVIMTYIARPW